MRWSASRGDAARSSAARAFGDMSVSPGHAAYAISHRGCMTVSSTGGATFARDVGDSSADMWAQWSRMRSSAPAHRNVTSGS
eukprot:5573208-Prymnesium_polylepis.1